MSQELVEVNYPRDEIGPEGSVISKTQGIRHFQKLNPGLVVLSVNKFKMNWETGEIECAFTAKKKYLVDGVTREKFLELMQTNANLLRDLDAANEKIEELERLLAQPPVEINQDVDCSPVTCHDEKEQAAIVKHDEEFAKTQEDLEATKDDGPKPGDKKVVNGEEYTYAKLVKPEATTVDGDVVEDSDGK